MGNKIFFILIVFSFIHQSCFKDELIEIESKFPRDTYQIESRIDLDTQEKLTDFGRKEYRAVVGDLVIEHVSDLTPLLNLEEVYGNIYIRYCPELKSLNGLQNLSYVEGGLRITNSGLTDLSTLEKLRVITENLIVQNLQAMEEMSGFHTLEYIGNYCIVQACSNLKSIDILSNLNKVKSHFEIINCPVLTSISAMDKLKEIGGHLFIYECDNLPYLKIMPALQKVESIKIEDCRNLLNLAGFDALESIYRLEIYNCDTLTEISTFNLIKFMDRINFLELTNLNQINAFGGLSEIGQLLSIQQCGIKDLHAFQSLKKLGYQGVQPKLAIRINSSLTDFCGLRNVDFVGNIQVDVEQNAYNPTIQEINSAACK